MGQVNHLTQFCFKNFSRPFPLIPFKKVSSPPILKVCLPAAGRIAERGEARARPQSARVNHLI